MKNGELQGVVSGAWFGSVEKKIMRYGFIRQWIDSF